MRLSLMSLILGLVLSKDDGFDYEEEVNWQNHEKCIDQHADCESWARKGECEINPSYMVSNCAKSCSSCYLLNPKEQCARAPDAKPTLAANQLTQKFTRIVTDFPEFRPTMLNSQGDPLIIYFDSLLDPDTISDLLLAYKESGQKFERSAELDSSKSKANRRTSESMPCNTPECWRDPRVLKVHDLVSKLLDIPLENQEFIQIVKYTENQYYVDHTDTSGSYLQFPQGHRVYTLFLYLTDVEEGGETHFPKLDLKVKPKKGAAVLWANVNEANPREIAAKSLHAGLPVQKGLKIAANMWLYQYDYRGPWICNWWKDLMNHN